jgi:asparagine synthase (glutamine-hydrolysing)
MFFFADWVTRGRILPAMREMMRRAALGRASVWELAYKNALLPLVPSALRRRLIHENGMMPPWLDAGAVRTYGLTRRSAACESYNGRFGHKYRDSMVAAIESLPARLPQGVFEEALEVAHPFLHRPLVEFALQLPPELCVQPHARKWILREAMRGILPEQVRTRVGKGVLYGLLSWSIADQRNRLQPLLRDPILAQLGVVNTDRLRRAFDAAQHEREGPNNPSADVQYTLAVEAWLQVRSGRWPPKLEVRRKSPTYQLST